MGKHPFFDDGAANSCFARVRDVKVPRWQQYIETGVEWLVASLILLISLTLGIGALWCILAKVFD